MLLSSPVTWLCGKFQVEFYRCLAMPFRSLIFQSLIQKLFFFAEYERLKRNRKQQWMPFCFMFGYSKRLFFLQLTKTQQKMWNKTVSKDWVEIISTQYTENIFCDKVRWIFFSLAILNKLKYVTRNVKLDVNLATAIINTFL